MKERNVSFFLSLRRRTQLRSRNFYVRMDLRSVRRATYKNMRCRGGGRFRKPLNLDKRQTVVERYVRTYVRGGR